MARFRVMAIHSDPSDFWSFVSETDDEGAAIVDAFRLNYGNNTPVNRFVTVDTENGQVAHISRCIAGGDW